MNWLQDTFSHSPVPYQNIASYLWLIIAFPLAGALINGVFGRWLGRANVGFIASGAVGASLVFSTLVLWATNDVNTVHPSAFSFDTARYALGWDYGTWFAAGDFQVRFGLVADHLTAVMLMVITGVGFLIHVYSTSYMSHDPGYARYFAYLNLFVAMMLTLVLADNLVLLFVGWEGVGLCSYLLIGFWYTDQAKAYAGRKAFITNRIGDFAFIVAMMLLVLLTTAFAQQATDQNFANGRRDRFEQGVTQVGPLAFSAVEAMSKGIGIGPVAGKVHKDTVIGSGPLEGHTVGGVITVILLLFLLGAAGKSAQIPLYVWLPDAMAGPTPVSALIHAATMVTAGVYLFARLSYLLVLSPAAMATVGIIGALTALLAAAIAFAQDDIKKVLAYSTVSQLGIMFMGVGFGLFWAAIFHLFTHAFFKACLFLGAGSVMHGNADEVDIKKLGGLRREMPWTWGTFAVATLAITGIVPLSGYFSKDAILHGIHSTHLANLGWVTNLVWITGLVVAFGTAFYMTRLYLLTFEGKRSPEAKVPHAHESDFAMVMPLVVLAFFAAFGLVWGLPLVTTPLGRQVIMENYLSPVFSAAGRIASGTQAFEVHHSPVWSAYLTASVIALSAGALAWYLYTRYFPAYRAAGKPVPSFARAVRTATVDKFYVDEAYGYLLRFLKGVATFAYRIVDTLVIDTLFVRGSAWVTYRVGALLRYLQTGDVQGYAAWMAAAVVLAVAYVLFAL